ncbi:MAG: ATP-grasp domain-containing protein [Ruminococcus sp.]|nr:ATP-grasp domain-containing protein [Ruminococcus sp.]
MKKIVLFSSNTKKRDSSSTCEVFPKWYEQWDASSLNNPDMEITLVVQLNGRYFLDILNGAITKAPEKIKVVTLEMDATIDDFIAAIKACEPDIAVAMPGPVSGYDWNGIRDAVIADGLRNEGIECICYSLQTAVDCFDKCKTHRFLKDHGFNVSEAVYVNHELFKTTKHERSSTINGYQESILWKIRELNAPVVIKSSTGSSSMGIHISEDFEDAKAYLLSDAFCEDVIVEKKFVGEEYGIEIHGSSGNYVVTPPYRIFRYDKGELNDPLGLTTLKYGPMTGEKYHVDELRSELFRLAELLGLSGIIEIDLFFVEGKWYILEINGRWSGITTLTCASQGRYPYEVYLDQVSGSKSDYNDIANLKYCCQFKMPKVESSLLDKMVRNGDVNNIISYEVIFPDGEKRWFNDAVSVGYDTLAQLGESFRELSEKYPDVISKECADELIADINKTISE